MRTSSKKTFSGHRCALGLAGGITLIASSFTQAEIPPEWSIANNREALIDFYHATNGDDWVNNDGWLGEPGTECDWYGVTCGDEENTGKLGYSLDLVNNGLSGKIPDSFGNAHGLTLFAAAHNDLSGLWRLQEGSYDQLSLVILDRTALTGIEIEPDAAPTLTAISIEGAELSEFPSGLKNAPELKSLNLSFNEMTGDLPPEITTLQLDYLEAPGNRLTGSILPAIQAMARKLPDEDDDNPVPDYLLDLRGNLFSGQIDETILEEKRPFDHWLNLCWNGMAPPSPAATEWLKTEHVERPFSKCLDKTIQKPGPTVSGSWFDPERQGEGFSIMLLEDGQTLLNWYSYPVKGSQKGDQSWLMGNRFIGHPGLEPLTVDAPMEGRFSKGLASSGSYPIALGGSVNLAWLESGELFTEQDIFDPTQELRFEQYEGMIQLTRLAGTTCQNQSPFQQYSGAWYNPSNDGEGFIFEVLPSNSLNVYWFTYQPNDSGHQAWMVGSANFLDDGSGTKTNSAFAASAEGRMIQPTGANFGPEFNPQDVELVEWGELRIQFNDANTGKVIWNSEIDGYGSGEYPIERLAQPKLADCD